MNVVYYRLKQTDYNGSFAYSKTIAVKNSENDEGITVSPNPSENGVFDVLMSGKKSDENRVIEILDLTGRPLMRNSVNTSDFIIDLSTFPRGMYIVKIISAEKMVCKKIVYR